MSNNIISLRKNEVISLKKIDSIKTATGDFKKVTIGLKWGKIGGTKENAGFFEKVKSFFKSVNQEDVDLDSCVIAYDKDKFLIDTIYFHKKKSCSKIGYGSILHHGDDVVGSSFETDKDNEQIDIDFSSVNTNVKYLVIAINSYSGHNIASLPFATMRLKVAGKKNVVAKWNVEGLSVETKSLIFGVFYRDSQGGWDFKAMDLTSRDPRIGDITRNSGKSAIQDL